MTYTSIKFIFFVLATALIYFVLPWKKYRWTVLLAASAVFYCLASYKYAVFILFTALSTLLIGLWLDDVNRKGKQLLKANKGEWDREQKKAFKNKQKVKKRWIMALCLILNFGILAFLKYYNFFSGSLNDILGSFGIDFSVPTLKLFLPLGISFYTFQSMGYIVDVYREKVKPQTNPFKFLLFVSFFPQIIQGPISNYTQLGHQLFEGHDFNFTQFKYGSQLILWGFFKKLVIADRAVVAINAVTATPQGYNKYSGTTLTFTILLYAFQLYTDFSGGIDISRGVALLFGIDLIDNFKRPYFSKSINEYWRRWHISLGAWMKDYIFNPLAISSAFLNASKKMRGTKFGKTKAGAHIAKVLPTAFASLIVFLIVGIWHGANYKYVAFGVWNGGIIMLSILMQPLFDAVTDKLHINRNNFFFRLFQMVRTFLVVLVGYVFDVAPSFQQGMMTIGRFFTDQDFERGSQEIFKLGINWKDYILLAVCVVVIWAVSMIQEKHSDTTIREMLDKKPFILRWLVFFLLIMAVIIFGIYGSGYAASDFVYMQF